MITANQLKGALLEFLVRKLLINCGFTSVKPDKHYIYKNSTGLLFINGRGAAHDADVLMDPPFQMPFSYPARLLFECKAFGKKADLSIVRNALGLYHDINNFEIVTDDFIERRQNIMRSDYAISDRIRYNYQVGVASINEFTKPAIEFAANNKIPLFSLCHILSPDICDLFSCIDEKYVNTMSSCIDKLYNFLKSCTLSKEIEIFIDNDRIIGEIILSFNKVLDKIFVGLLETGDLFFLTTNDDLYDFEIFRTELKARLYYDHEELNYWILKFNNARFNFPTFRFYLPNRIMNQWRNFHFDKKKIIEIKNDSFSRFFIFGNFPRYNNTPLPFYVVNIDKDWLNEIKNENID